MTVAAKYFGLAELIVLTVRSQSLIRRRIQTFELELELMVEKMSGEVLRN